MSQNINSFATPSVTLNNSIDSGTSNINSECYAVQNSIDCGTSNINSIDSNYMESESLQNAPDALKEISVEVPALLLEAYAEIIKCDDLNFKISKFKTILMEVRVKVLDCEEEVKRVTGRHPRKHPLFLDVANNVHMDLSSKSIPPIDASTKFAALKKETKDPNYLSRMAEFIESNGNLPPQQISPSTSSHGTMADYNIQN
uniref:Uncharacterized protein n=1 Tax=Fagus sylvatica TaxID=28930 RepID=A0A2N9IIM7_FAGSY